MTWQCLTPKVTVKCFKKCSISIALDGSEEGGDVRSECEEVEGTDCEGGDIDTDW
jgi:hypothetical protein